MIPHQPKLDQVLALTPKKDQDLTATETFTVLEAYLESGLSFFPIQAGGQKAPAFDLLPSVQRPDNTRRKTWAVYRERQPTQQEITTWCDAIRNGHKLGFACVIMNGSRMEVLDFDEWDIAKQYLKRLRGRAPDLERRLVKVKTPRPGLHMWYRCESAAGSTKLASAFQADSEGKSQRKTLIETKGAGGYCVCPPTAAACHQSGRHYRVISKYGLTSIPTISVKERQRLLEIAQEFDQRPKSPSVEQRIVLSQARPSAARNLLRPGDTYNDSASWEEILEPHGWICVGDDGNNLQYWRRPNKSTGVSATTNYEGRDLLYIFSSNASPFQEQRSYNKFTAFTLLNCHGDFRQATQMLRNQGYGRLQIRSWNKQ